MSHDFARLEARLKAAARATETPAFPDLAPLVRARLAAPVPPPSVATRQRLALAAAAIIVAIAASATLPAVRAEVGRWLKIGAVRILMPPVTATPAPAATNDTRLSHPTPTRQTGIAYLGELTGETNLLDAALAVPFPIRLPTEPEGLGPPDRVFLQHAGAPALVMAWTAESDRDRADLVLYIVGEGAWLSKLSPQVVDETTINGTPALWVEGSHYLIPQGAEGALMARLVEGNVLAWEGDGVTYRLETGRPLAEAVRIAESLAAP